MTKPKTPRKPKLTKQERLVKDAAEALCGIWNWDQNPKLFCHTYDVDPKQYDREADDYRFAAGQYFEDRSTSIVLQVANELKKDQVETWEILAAEMRKLGARP